MLAETGTFPWAGPVLLVCTAFVIVWMVVSAVLLARMKKKLQEKRVEQTKTEMLECLTRAKQDLEQEQKRLLNQLRIGIVYLVVLVLFAIVILFLSGLSDVSYLIPSVLLAIYIFSGFFERLMVIREKSTFTGHLDRAEFPKIYGALDRASEKLGIREKLTVITDSQFNATVFSEGGRHYINLGVRLLSSLDEIELEQLFLHELAHLSNRDVQNTGKIGRVLDFLLGGQNPNVKHMGNVFFDFPALYLLYCFTVSEMTSSLVKETRADDAILQYGDPSAYASALAKMEYHTLFTNEIDRFMTEPFYAPEEPQPYNAPYLAHFFRAAKERGAFWRGIIEQELPTLMETHPTFGERWRAIGQPVYDPIFPDLNATDAFTKECREATDRVDRQVMELMKAEYAEERKEAYLKPLDIVEKWEQSGKELLSVDRMTPIIEAYRQLLRYRDVMELCDRLIASDAAPMSLAYVKFVKGIELLNFFDPEGIRLIEEAAESNHNAVEAGYSAIVLFCRRMGMKEELEYYRKKQVELAQVQVDTYGHADSLDPKDDLSVESLPEGRAEAAVEFILSIGQDRVSEIYLVRKTVTKDFFVSAYVIRFLDDTDYEIINEVMDRIFQYLDKAPYDWEYALFFYDKTKHERIFKKLPECRIYKREK